MKNILAFMLAELERATVVDITLQYVTMKCEAKKTPEESVLFESVCRAFNRFTKLKREHLTVIDSTELIPALSGRWLWFSLSPKQAAEFELTASFADPPLLSV